MEQVNSSPQWLQALEHQCRVMIGLGDILLKRYRMPKRTSGSLAARYFLRSVQQLRCFGVTLLDGDRQRLALMEEAMEERMRLLRHRWVLPCRQLRELRRQCILLEQLLVTTVPTRQAQWDTANVLVGTLRRPSQLDVCLSHGFYHVPVSQIPPDRLPIDYVAIYQSRSMFPEDCGIRFYGRVKRCTTLPRYRISQIPKASDELYYRLDIVRWEQLDPPIGVREIPFTHLFTNLFLLQHSKETPELVLHSMEEYRRFQALRLGTQWGSGTVFRHPNGKVRLRRGYFRVSRRGRKTAAFRMSDFLRTPAAVFRQMMYILEEES